MLDTFCLTTFRHYCSSILLIVKGGLSFIFLVSFMLILTPGVQAVEVDGLYRASALVDSRNDDRERQQAFASAMAEVLVKVSGTNESLLPSAVRQALNNPQAYVETWVYHSIEVDSLGNAIEVDTTQSIEGSDTQLIEIEVSFYESEILELLNSNSLPLWPSNRQTTLVWVVARDELGNREIYSSSTAKIDIVDILEQKAKQRGLPLRFPLMDLQDQRAMSENALWNLDAQAILQASERYDADSVLALRAYRSLGGELLGKSLYLFRDRGQQQASFELSLEEFVENSISMATQELSGYYSILLSNNNSGSSVNLTVEGIDTAKAYAELLNYVGGLTDVNSFQVISIDGENILLQLSTGGQLRQLIETIAIESSLEPIANLSRDGNQVRLFYRWLD